MTVDRWFLWASFCAVLVSAFNASTVLANAQRPTPWLAGVTANSVYASLEATDATPATVEYGRVGFGYTDTASTQSTDTTTLGTLVHNIALSGLEPNTEYHYRVTHGASVSADYAFWTAPAPGTPAHFGFAADSRSYPDTHNTVAANIAAHDPNMMFYGGDLCNVPDYSSWNREWFVTNQNALNATAPFVNSPGNHEDWVAAPNTWAFTESPSGNDDAYFSFDYGDAHILVLNNEIPDGPGSALWNFAAADLAASTAKFKIVTFHRPALGYGGHSSDTDMAAMTSAIFEPNGVNFVMAGHSHYYQHNLKNDIHHMTIGSMGAPLYTPGTGTYNVYSERTESFAMFDTDGDTITLRTYRGLDGNPVTALIETITIVVPEPSSLLLVVAGGLLLATVKFAGRWRRRGP